MPTTPDVDRLLGDLIASRAADTGSLPEEVARAALLRGFVTSSAERVKAAAEVRAMTPRRLDDSTLLIRRMRDAR